MNVYRTGRKLGRTIYRDDALIGIMDTPEDGALVVEALNARERVLAARGTFAGSPGPPEGETDRNARAYGWEIGRGQPIDAVIKSTEGNPFLDPDWRDKV